MKINIGTTRGNIVGVEVDKDFDEIKLVDLMPFIKERFGDLKLNVVGWCPFVENKGQFLFDVLKNNYE